MRPAGATSVNEVVCLASWNADLVSRVPRPIARGETLLASGFTIGPGGKGSNAAVACARQGAKVAVIARIGDDDFGRMALALWAREGIDASMVEVVDGEPSGVAQILVYDDGDNSIAVAPGAGAGLGARHADAAAERLCKAHVVMASCEVPIEAMIAAFAQARRGGRARPRARGDGLVRGASGGDARRIRARPQGRCPHPAQPRAGPAAAR